MNAFINLFFEYFPYLKGIGFLLALLWGGLSLYYGIKTSWIIKQFEHFTDAFIGSVRFKKRTIKAWKEVSQHLNTNDEREWKLAILEADILLEQTLHILGARGKKIGEMLRNIDESTLSNIEEVREAHRLRNHIAHEYNVDLDRDVVERTLAAYHEALRQLGVVS